MYRSSSRRTVAALVVLAATLLVSPLSAAPLFAPGVASTAQSDSPSLLSSIWELVSDLWTTASPAVPVPSAVTTTGVAQTGSCIDPMGGTPPCKK